MTLTCADCMPERVLVYVHVPFCVRKCRYCAFVSHVYSPDAADRYLTLLEREMAVWAERYGCLCADTVYVGGGTPSLLTPKQVTWLFDALERFFDLGQTREVSMEANPESVCAPGFLETARDRGVSRISLGVQSLHDATLRLLGRPHDRQTVVRAVRAVRDAGISSLNLDLIWGVPGQNLNMWLDDVRQAIALEPEHLSCYGLSLEHGTLLLDQVMRQELHMPSEDCASQMFVRGCQSVEEAGFAQYEISNFARHGHMCQHNLGYWAGSSYAGLGPAAVSTMSGMRWTNASALDDYARGLAAGVSGQDVELLTSHVQAREMIMLSLRTRAGLDLEWFQAKTGCDFLRHTGSFIEQLCASDLAQVSSNHFSLTRQGMLVSDSILATLLEYVDHVTGDIL
ncbi:hypothetical protein MASR1M90_00500 [Desulfovibrionales bacterium]